MALKYGFDEQKHFPPSLCDGINFLSAVFFALLVFAVTGVAKKGE